MSLMPGARAERRRANLSRSSGFGASPVTTLDQQEWLLDVVDRVLRAEREDRHAVMRADCTTRNPARLPIL